MSDYTIQGSEAWLNFRKGKIMASEAAAVMGLNPYESAYDLWRRKLGLLPEIEQNEAMLEGHRLETEARRYIEEILGKKLYPNVIIHMDYSWMAASLDGIDDTGSVIVEIKCGKRQNEELEAGIISPMINCQVQHQMACTGLDMCRIFGYRSPTDCRIRIIERDDVFISELIEKCRDFYRRLKEFDPPHPKHRKLEGEEMQEAVDTYRIAKDMLARAEKHEQEARSKLLLLSQGECIEGYGLKVTHYTQRGAIDYSSIPQLKDVDLDKYRKPPAIRTKIT